MTCKLYVYRLEPGGDLYMLISYLTFPPTLTISYHTVPAMSCMTFRHTAPPALSPYPCSLLEVGTYANTAETHGSIDLGLPDWWVTFASTIEEVLFSTNS